MEAVRDMFTSIATDAETKPAPPTPSPNGEQSPTPAQEEAFIYRGPRKRLDYPILAFLQDALIVIATLIGGNMLYGTEIAATLLSVQTLGALGLAFLIWAMVFFSNDLYRLSKYYEPLKEGRRLAVALLVTLFGWAGLFALLNMTYPNRLLVQSVLTMAIGMLAWRLLFQVVQRISHMQAYNETKRTLLIGTGNEVKQLLHLLKQAGPLGIEPIGILTDRKTNSVSGIPVFGGFDEDLRGLIAGRSAEAAIVMLDKPFHAQQADILEILQKSKLTTWVLPDYFDLPLHGNHLADMADLPLVDVTTPRLNAVGLFLKRALDIVTALMALLVVAPVMMVTAIAIKSDSPGPILFRQKRIGKDGKPFEIYKFRSMVADADSQLDTVAEHDEAGHITNHKKPDDPRVTRIGRFIRATSIDELPQLFNVLQGNMTLVGPRPELTRLVSEYAPWQHKRFAMTQGITGWWQVNGRSDRPCHLSTDKDMTYIQHYSFLLDIQILLMTIPAVLNGKGAY